MLSKSSNNSIIGNKLLKNSDYVIKNYDSENNTIANKIKANGGGIDNEGYISRNTVVSSNQIIGNSGYGIQAGTKCIITGNIEGNGQYGVYFYLYF